MKLSIKYLGLLLGAAVVVACGGGDTDEFGNDLPDITASFPCAARPGDQVVIRGRHFQGIGQPPTVRFGDRNGTIVSQSDTKIVATVPAAGVDGPLQVSNTIGASAAAEDFKYRQATVFEMEPNDQTNGGDATQMSGQGIAEGSLSSVTDRDHFRFDCMTPFFTYRIKVSPAVVDVVYLNGAPLNLDANGETTFSAQSSVNIVGLTAGTGAYTLTMTLE